MGQHESFGNIRYDIQADGDTVEVGGDVKPAFKGVNSPLELDVTGKVVQETDTTPDGIFIGYIPPELDSPVYPDDEHSRAAFRDVEDGPRQTEPAQQTTQPIAGRFWTPREREDDTPSADSRSRYN